VKADRDEVVKVLDTRIRERQRDNLATVEQAAVEAEKLTSDPRWNIFLQQIQKWKNDSESNLKSLNERHSDPELTNPDEITRIKNAILMNKQDIDTLDRVISLPKSIIDDGKKAKSLLANLFK